jgi:hypothetical protein
VNAPTLLVVEDDPTLGLELTYIQRFGRIELQKKWKPT